MIDDTRYEITEKPVFRSEMIYNVHLDMTEHIFVSKIILVMKMPRMRRGKDYALVLATHSFQRGSDLISASTCL